MNVTKVAKEILSAKPINIDKPSVRRLAHELASSIKQFMQSLDNDALIGNKILATVSHEVKFLQGQKLNISVEVKSVQGNFKQLILGGHIIGNYDTTKRSINVFGLSIIIDVNGSVKPISYFQSKTLTEDLYSMLLHEVTHAIDFSGVFNQKKTDGLTAYYNRPREVRAYMQQIVDEIQKVIQSVIKKYGQNVNRHKLTDELLNLSQTWMKFKDYWNNDSKRKIIQAVYHEVDVYADAADAGF